MKKSLAKKKSKLLPQEVRKAIITLAGQFKKPTFILEEIKELYPEELESFKNIKKTIYNIMDGSKDQINALREQHCKSLLEVPIAHKKIRLERLEDQYDNAVGVDKSVQVLRAAREEMEGSKVNLSLYQMNFFGKMSDEELERRIAEIASRVQTFAGGAGSEVEEESLSVLQTTHEAEDISFKPC